MARLTRLVAFVVVGDSGIAALTNGGADATRRLLERGGLADLLGVVVSVEEVRAYKPATLPYVHAAARLGAAPGELTLVAAHAWDVVGASAAGLGAVWVDRLERVWPFPLPQPPTAPDLERAVETALAG